MASPPHERGERRWVERVPGGAGGLDGPPPPLRPLAEHLAFAVAVVDKPAGLSSHDVVNSVRGLFDTRKAGHGGTLDPNATGVLPVFLGAATRLSSMLLEVGKEYVAEARLHGDVARQDLEAALGRFRGEIMQLPPIRSRVKREWRPRSIYELEVLALEGRAARLRVSCEAGTYVRKLVHDLGQALRCGAHMEGLRRSRAGIFRIEQAASLEVLADAARKARTGDEAALRRFVLSAEVLSCLLPRMVADAGALGAIASGIPLRVPGVLAYEAPFEEGEELALLSPAGAWVATGTAGMPSEALASAEKGTAAKIKKVFTQKATQPRA